MNLNDIPKPNFDQQGLSSEFFNLQTAAILRKTTDLENWSLPDSKLIESYFPVPDGYWLKMEDGIRAKTIHPEASQPIIVWKTAMQWTTACFGILLIGIGSFFFWPSNKMAQPESWSAQLEQVSESELLAYVSDNHNSDKETTELIAIQYLDESEIPTHASSLNDKEIEITIEDLSNSDLTQDITNN